MITALALWRRLPVVVRAVVSGWLVTAVGTGLWVVWGYSGLAAAMQTETTARAGD